MANSRKRRNNPILEEIWNRVVEAVPYEKKCNKSKGTKKHKIKREAKSRVKDESPAVMPKLEPEVSLPKSVELPLVKHEVKDENLAQLFLGNEVKSSFPPPRAAFFSSTYYDKEPGIGLELPVPDLPVVGWDEAEEEDAETYFRLSKSKSSFQ